MLLQRWRGWLEALAATDNPNPNPSPNPNPDPNPNPTPNPNPNANPNPNPNPNPNQTARELRAAVAIQARFRGRVSRETSFRGRVARETNAATDAAEASAGAASDSATLSLAASAEAEFRLLDWRALCVQYLLLLEATFGWVTGCAWTDALVAYTPLRENTLEKPWVVPEVGIRVGARGWG